MKKIASVLFALALVFAMSSASLAAGKVLGSFKQMDGDGKEVTQEVLKGKKTVLVFSQMACRQCRVEMGEISQNVDAFKGRVYVVLVDINSQVALEQYKKAGYKMPVIIDPDFNIPDSVKLATTPSTVVVDEKLNVIDEKVGYVTGQWQELVKNL